MEATIELNVAEQVEVAAEAVTELTGVDLSFVGGGLAVLFY